MLPRICCETSKLLLIAVATLAVSACSSVGDFGRLQAPLAGDDVHAWVGQEAAAHVGANISLNNLTDDERTLRDLAFPLIEPPYDRDRWDAVVYEYGQKREFRQDLWVFDRLAYYGHLTGEFHRSTIGRYNQLIDDMRNDIVRIDPFFQTARRVIDVDLRRRKSMQYVHDLNPVERDSALARVGENSLTIIWVHRSLEQRCAAYRYALEHLTVAEPAPIAADAEHVLMELQQQIEANPVGAPLFPATAGRIVSK